MKLTPPYLSLFILMLCCCVQTNFATTISQNPDQVRHFDDDFKSRYQDERFNYQGRAVVRRTKSGSGVYETYRNGEATDEPHETEEENNQRDFHINLGPLGWFFYLAIALAVVALVYLLVKEGGSGLFSTKRNKSLNPDEDITAENIENIDIETLIKQAENDTNFRLAIRYYYLLTLKTLSRNNLITFEDDKTNAEYLTELQQTAHFKNFGYISYLYNYIWYGEFPVDLQKYQKAKTHFTDFLKPLKS
ncbi:hypothetical protein JJL45_06550 [Tamlana sp. s12]|uniref:hypothetical protein n=1 Tax=Tamlana sp. s12 TaxID=1630406 RepID=UPI00192BB1C9|nr:hypothetical protein [Tamlana sp. s12]QQY83644.1 hypothetical protein JJL45_06550 [Tamlana sp. s12]